MNNIFPATGVAFVVIFTVFLINTALANAGQKTSSHSEHRHEKQSLPHFEPTTREPTTREPTAFEHTKGKATAANEHEEGIWLSDENIKLAGIKVEQVFPQSQLNEVYAPGEVKANGYNSYLVSPRTDSVVINRHASLGEHVKAGQELVTLFSETMAQTQADLLIASSNWQRAQQLGRDNVSQRSLVEAENTYRGIYGKLIAFGLTPQAIEKIDQQDISTFGQYALVAERDGVVLQDNFMQGQRIESGETIMLLADEKELWIEAFIPPNRGLELTAGSPALIELNGNKYPAKVIQEAHTIDPVTRTRIVRLSVNNAGHNLHSGMFVKVYFQIASNNKVIAVPEQALIRSHDGDWTVFIEEQTNEFKAVEVTRGQTFGDQQQIFGLNAGVKVVTRGAFFIASEIAKSGFDPHNH